MEIPPGEFNAFVREVSSPLPLSLSLSRSLPPSLVSHTPGEFNDVVSEVV